MMNFLDAMMNTPQNPIFHGEGDVFTHTMMVCRALNDMPGFHALSSRRRLEVFTAALLHDIGKVKTTRIEGGELTSPHHSSAGNKIARELLWHECGLCGTPDKQAFRETVCALVRWHMLPVHIITQDNPELEARRVASLGELAPDFSFSMLCLLSESDVRGRVADDTEEMLSRVQLCRLVAEESQCLNEPYQFADLYTKHAYLSGRNVQPEQSLYNDTWGEVIVMSGLPGTGKDTWIKHNVPGLPVISLDAIRRELRVKPTDSQSEVAHAAHERSKEFLRKRQPFVWNATSLTRDIRRKNIDLFERYGARVRIVYLEAEEEVRAKRNIERKDSVPESAVTEMLGKMTPPTPDEAQSVEWWCV